MDTPKEAFQTVSRVRQWLEDIRGCDDGGQVVSCQQCIVVFDELMAQLLELETYLKKVSGLVEEDEKIHKEMMKDPENQRKARILQAILSGKAQVIEVPVGDVMAAKAADCFAGAEDARQKVVQAVAGSLANVAEKKTQEEEEQDDGPEISWAD